MDERTKRVFAKDFIRRHPDLARAIADELLKGVSSTEELKELLEGIQLSKC